MEMKGSLSSFIQKKKNTMTSTKKKRFNDEDMYLTLAFEAIVVVQEVVDVTLIFFYNSLLVLKDCLYVL